MPKLHEGWMRTRTPDGYDPPPELLLYARKALGALLEHAHTTGLTVARRDHYLPDGAQITVSWDGVTPVASITPAPAAAPLFTTDLSSLWVPRGFVVYPVWHTAPAGYGLPIVRDTTAGAYDKANLAPGLDTNRWTAGGPCGEVLLTPDSNAGYQSLRLLPAPLLYHPTRGPTFQWTGKGAYDARKPTNAWKAYRMELAAPEAFFADEDTSSTEALFEQINAQRTQNGQPALNLLPRGYYHPAQVMVSIMQAAGSTAASDAGYPPTYTNEADRLTKDGYSATIMAVAPATWVRGGHPTSFELRALGGTAADVLATWQATPDEQAVLLKDVGPAAFGDVGFRGGYWAANVTERDRWIEAGNAYWKSPDTALPPLSWHSFAGVSLAWETYPATYDIANYTTSPLAPLSSFTDGNGDCWLNYPRKTAATPADLEPALSRHIYLRGRAIALAPRGGLIWGACLMTVTTDAGAVDRLLALVHHPEDQPTDYTNEGFTRYLRVWWADIPHREHLRAAPQQTICGEDTSDAWSWRGGQLVDVGALSAPAAGFTASAPVNSLKYASCWRFSPDGTRAVCLRDYGSYADYSIIGADAVGGIWSASLNPRAVELTFTPEQTTTGVTVTAHEFTAGFTADERQLDDFTPPDTHDVFNLNMYEQGAIPIAVDYAANGAMVYAYSGRVASQQVVTYAPTDGSTGFTTRLSYAYVGVGDATVRYPTELQHRVLHGARFLTSSTARYYEQAQVLDVVSGAFALKASRPHYSVVPSDAAATVAIVEQACQTFTTEPVDGVVLCRAGTVLYEDWYPSPDGAIFTTNDPCYLSLTDANSRRVFLPLAASANVQGYYATQFDAVVFGYQCAPVAKAAWMLSSEPSSSACGCTITSTALAAARLMTTGESSPRGGRVVSGVPLPSNDWLFYVKAV